MQKTFTRGEKKLLKISKIFLLKSDDKSEKDQQTSKKEPPNKSTKTDFDEFNEQIIKEETGINRELFKNYLNFQMPTEMLKTLYNLNNKMKNNLLVKTIKSGLIDSENEIKKMSEDEIKIENPYKIVNIVEKILEFNKLN